jgi:transporter family-2 protein
LIHIIGLVFITAIVLAKRERPFAKWHPWYYYLPGVLGIMTVAFNSYAFGRISVSAIMALILLGQSVMSLAFDQYGWLGLPKNPFRKQRFIGLALTIGGIAIMIDRLDTAPVVMSFAAGCMVVVTRTLSARFATLTSINISTFFNYVFGLSCAFLVLLLLGVNEPAVLSVGISPNIYIYLGGIIGACLVLACNILVMKVPAFYLSVLMFIGQVFAGIIIDAIIAQSFSAKLLTGGLLVAAGLCVDMWLEKRKPPNPAAS